MRLTLWLLFTQQVQFSSHKWNISKWLLTAQGEEMWTSCILTVCVCCVTSDGQFLDVWIGLVSTDTNVSVFKWIDQNPVTFTYWAPNQPVYSTEGRACVFYTGEVCLCVCVWCCQGLDVLLLHLLFLHTRPPNLKICVHPQNHGWQVGNCTTKLPFMCQKKGEIKESAPQPGCNLKDVSSSVAAVCFVIMLLPKTVLTALCSVMYCRLSFGRIFFPH